MSTSYHVYYNGKVLFKNLNEEEFDVVWSRIYHSYHTDSISYEKCGEENLEGVEQSY